MWKQQHQRQKKCCGCQHTRERWRHRTGKNKCPGISSTILSLGTWKAWYQELNPRSKVCYLLNGSRCDKLSTAAATENPDKYEKDFDAVAAFLTQYINKQKPTQSVNVVTITQNRPAKRQKIITSCDIFKEKIQLRKYSSEKYDSMSMVYQQQLYKLWCKAGLLKGKKTP